MVHISSRNYDSRQERTRFLGCPISRAFRDVGPRSHIESRKQFSPEPSFSIWSVIDVDRSRFSVGVEAEAAPPPLVWLGHESSFDRITMHIAQLFYALFLRPNIKVIKPALPNVCGSICWQKKLVAASSCGKKPASKSDLDGLHHHRRISALRFADQQVNMFRHDHIANDHKNVSFTHGFQHQKKKVAAASGA